MYYVGQGYNIFIINTQTYRSITVISIVTAHYFKDKEKLEKIQHRFLKLIPELKDLPCEDRTERLGIWTLEERRNRADLIEVYIMHRGPTKVSLETFFKINEASHTRGHPLKLKKKRCNTVLRQHFFSERDNAKSPG